MSPRALALLATAAFLVAGCAAKQPAGTLKATDYALAVPGSVQVTYQAYTGQNPTSGVPAAGSTTECAQGNVPKEPGSPVVYCKGPYSVFTSTAVLPQPSAAGYKLYAVGKGFEQELFTYTANGASFTGSFNDTKEDLSSKVTELQVRMDGVAVATAKGAAGNNSLAPAITGLTVTGTFKGHHLDLTVAGLPANGTFMAKLYVKDAASPTGYTAKESFQVKDGANAYDSKDHNIADFAQLHIHVGDSMVNLYKATIEVPAK